jgi:hydrogenase-4 component F
MIALYSILGIPILGIMAMLLIGKRQIACTVNMVISFCGFAASLFLAVNIWQFHFLITKGQQLYVDSFSILSIVLTTFIVFTTAIFSCNYMWHSVVTKRISGGQLQLYHVMYQTFTLMMLLALVANNIGILWVAMEGATLATVLLVSLYRTPEAVEAAWKYFILCIVGIALALFGTVLIYFSATGLADANSNAILWNFLYQHAPKLDSAIVKIAFVFLLVGYGTKIGLVPLHNWLPDAHSESPAPMSTLLSGLLLNVALYALVRFKVLADLALNSNLAGTLMMGFGLLSFFVAAVLLHRQQNIKRLFSYSSIEHMGLMTFAFGLGSEAATFVALFYMLMHSLVKAAIFVTAGNVIQLTETQSMEKIRGLIQGSPLVGWGLLIASLAISGLPPFGIFTSEFLLLIATLKTLPWVAALLLVGLVVAFSGMLKNIQPMVFGEPNDWQHSKICMFPVFVHLTIVLILGLYLPSSLADILHQAATMIATKFVA